MICLTLGAAMNGSYPSMSDTVADFWQWVAVNSLTKVTVDDNHHWKGFENKCQITLTVDLGRRNSVIYIDSRKMHTI